MSDKTIIHSDVPAALAAGAASVGIKTVDLASLKGQAPYAIVPEGYELQECTDFLLQPIRKAGTTKLNDAASFIAVVNDQKGEATRLYSTVNPPTFLAVFNDTSAEPGWRDHRASYNAPLSPEWQIWLGSSGKACSQTDFAAFIEANMLDIIEPEGAVMLEVSRSLEAKKKVEFASSIRLSDGSVQFNYEEDIQGSAHKGQLKVPEVFVLAIPVFENGEPWRVEAKLRYRINDGGKLAIWYELVRPHKVIEAAVKDLRAKIAEGTGLDILVGAPA
ncbi:uncharacterized protein YfdQ (DUF2303 family) [Pseudacidovorax sp. 1753]|uniref:DUF2303 family protein n=1 Tax=Pseudacidovorax sp. 1753 TaxID=3156419 RepID=UPI00339378DE